MSGEKFPLPWWARKIVREMPRGPDALGTHEGTRLLSGLPQAYFAVLARVLVTVATRTAETVEISFAQLFTPHCRHQCLLQAGQAQTMTVTLNFRITLAPSHETFDTLEFHGC